MDTNVPLLIKKISAKIVERVGLLRQSFTTSTKIKIVDKITINDTDFVSIFNNK